MRLYDLITIYEDVIKKHDMFAEFNRYDLILIVDGDGGSLQNEVAIIISEYREQIYLFADPYTTAKEWMEDNLPEGDGEIIYSNEANKTFTNEDAAIKAFNKYLQDNPNQYARIRKVVGDFK